MFLYFSMLLIFVTIKDSEFQAIHTNNETKKKHLIKMKYFVISHCTDRQSTTVHFFSFSF